MFCFKNGNFSRWHRSWPPGAGRVFKAFFLFGVLAVLWSLWLVPATAGTVTFTDLGGHWAAAAVQQAVAAGYLKGYPDGTFKPDQGVTRAEFVAILNQAFKVSGSGSGQLPYRDVSKNGWYYSAISSAVARGYVDGYADGTFRPDQAITRQEAAVWLDRLLNLQGEATLSFKDASVIASEARDAVARLAVKKIMSGYPDGTFGPKRTITRAEAAVLVGKALASGSTTANGTKPVSVYLQVKGSLVNIRSAPNTGSAVLGQVQEWDVLQAAAQTADNWYQVQFKGGTGWIAGWLVDVYQTKPPARGDPGTLDVRVSSSDSRVVVTITSDEQTSFTWQDEAEGLVVTVPGVSVVRTPLSISVGQLGIDRVETTLQSGDPGQARVKLVYSGSPGPSCQVDNSTPGTVKVTVAPQISQVSAAKEGDGVAVTVQGSASLSYNYFRLQNPKRLVFDFSGFVLNGSLRNWQADPGVAGFSSLRISQFQENTVRLVAEVTGSFSLSKETSNGGKTMVLHFQPAAPGSKKVVLDPGHGGSDPGAIGPDGVQEKDVNLAIAEKAADYLRKQGVEVTLTRGAEFVGLAERGQLANDLEADVFVSIHANSVGNNPSVGGTGTYTYAPAGSALEGQRSVRLELAELLQQELVKALGLRDTGIHEANYQVLRDTTMPAALVEVAFISNPQEEQLLNSPGFQDQAAQAIAQGIIKFLEQ